MVGCTLFKLCHCKCAKAYLLEILGMSRLWHDLMAHGHYIIISFNIHSLHAEFFIHNLFFLLQAIIKIVHVQPVHKCCIHVLHKHDQGWHGEDFVIAILWTSGCLSKIP